MFATGDCHSFVEWMSKADEIELTNGLLVEVERMTLGLLRRIIKSRTTRGLREAIQAVMREYRFSRKHLASFRKARRMKMEPDCKLNLGCGTVRKEGWI